MSFLALVLGKFFSNETVQKEAGNIIAKAKKPESFYRESCIEVINEARALYLKMFENKPLPELLQYWHEYNGEPLPTDGKLCPSNNLKNRIPPIIPPIAN